MARSCSFPSSQVKVVLAEVLLLDPSDDEDVGRDVLPGDSLLLVEEEEVAQDVDVSGRPAKWSWSVTISSTISSRWTSVSAIGLPSEVG